MQMYINAQEMINKLCKEQPAIKLCGLVEGNDELVALLECLNNTNYHADFMLDALRSSANNTPITKTWADYNINKDWLTTHSLGDYDTPESLRRALYNAALVLTPSSNLNLSNVDYALHLCKTLLTISHIISDASSLEAPMWQQACIASVAEILKSCSTQELKEIGRQSKNDLRRHEQEKRAKNAIYPMRAKNASLFAAPTPSQPAGNLGGARCANTKKAS